MDSNAVRVTFLPSGKVYEARRGKSILDVAKDNNVRIYFECDSLCTCGTCFVDVVEGAKNLTPIHDGERAHLERQDLSNSHRLSCQARLMDDVTVRIPESR